MLHFQGSFTAGIVPFEQKSVKVFSINKKEARLVPTSYFLLSLFLSSPVSYGSHHCYKVKIIFGAHKLTPNTDSILDTTTRDIRAIIIHSLYCNCSGNWGGINQMQNNSQAGF